MNGDSGTEWKQWNRMETVEQNGNSGNEWSGMETHHGMEQGQLGIVCSEIDKMEWKQDGMDWKQDGME